KGAVTNWNLELASPNVLVRQGWTRNSLKIGDAITIEGSMAKDGSNMANARRVTLPDGRRGFGGSASNSGPQQQGPTPLATLGGPGSKHQKQESSRAKASCRLRGDRHHRGGPDRRSAAAIRLAGAGSRRPADGCHLAGGQRRRRSGARRCRAARSDA